MKSFIFAAFALLSAPMIASAEDGGNWPSYYDLNPGPVVIRSCIEGKTELFIESDPSSDRDVRVLRTCINGSFVRTTKAVKARACKNGRIERFHEFDGAQGRDVWVTVQCRNGRMVVISKN